MPTDPSPSFTNNTARDRCTAKPSPIAVRLGRLACICVGLSVLPAAAQDGAPRIRVGEASLFPSLRIDYLRDDNVYRTVDDPVSAASVQVRPRIDFIADRRQVRLSASYAGAYSSGDEEAQQWADHAIDARMDAGLGIRRRVELSARLARSHEDAGENLTQGLRDLGDDLVDFNDAGLFAAFTYGARAARGNLSVGVRYEQRSYTSLPELTDGLDYTGVEPYARFGYRLGGDTRGIVELAYKTLSFDNPTADSDAFGTFLGLQFNATGRLEGSFRLGVRQTDYAPAESDDEAVFTVLGNVRFSPSTLSAFTLYVSRESDSTSLSVLDSASVGSVRSVARLAWEYSWSPRVGTRAFVGVEDITRDCPESDTTSLSAGLEGDVTVRRWVRLGARIGGQTRSTGSCPSDTEDSLDYDRQTAGVYIRFSL